jgi:hypothetical protein
MQPLTRFDVAVPLPSIPGCVEGGGTMGGLLFSSPDLSQRLLGGVAGDGGWSVLSHK